MKKTLLTLNLLLIFLGITYAQKVVDGYVKDSDGEPLTGVSIVIKGTTIGTITNQDGYYKITDNSIRVQGKGPAAACKGIGMLGHVCYPVISSPGDFH